MRSVFGNPVGVATEIDGLFKPLTDKFVQPLAGPVCKAIWPEKTDVHIAAICGCDPRNARRYMSGELPIPAILVAAIVVAITKR